MKVDFVPSDEIKDALTVRLDEEYWADVHPAVFGKKPVFSEDFLNEADFFTAFQEKEKSLALKYALNRLSMRGYTRYELEKLLKEKLVSEGSRQEALSACEEYGYLHDEKWAEAYVKTQISRKQGPAVIRKKLQEKGFSFDTIQTLINLVGTDPQKEAIRKILETRYRSRDFTNPKECNKVIGSLLRKGYSFDIIREIMGDMVETHSDL